MSMLRKKYILPAICVFIAVEAVLSILIQVIGGMANSIISFLSIVLCFFFHLLFFKRDVFWISTQIGLLTTVCADCFLVLLSPREQLLGMLFFSVTQVCYFLRIYYSQTSKKEQLLHVLLRLGCIVLIIAITVLILGKSTDALAIISVIYYANLIVNIAFAFRQGKEYRIFAIGLLLFSLCDLSVGLSVLDEIYINIPNESFLYRIVHPGFNLAWLFYVPSQALIALSNIKKITLQSA